uniref:PARP-type domain-containing protein n=1 Tax=Globodera rostochiensis TaxID=31243 RepID=A0A914GUL1_GLORO
MVQQHNHHPESVQLGQKSQISSIGRQLTADFHPAVKNVASAGQNLLRAFQNLSRHFYVYTAALYALGYSSSNSDEAEVREQSKHLQTVTEVLKKVHSEQIEWVEYFTSMTLTINRNCKTEKERLKGLLSGFLGRERELTKAVGKGKQTPGTLNSFYETELEAMRDQQIQRYRFFVDKHLEMLRRYRKWMQFSVILLENELELGGAEALLDQQTETERQRDGGEFGSQKNEIEQRSGEAKNKHSRREQSAQSDELREGQRKRIVAELTKKFGTEGVGPAGRRRDFPGKLFRPTPIVPATKYRHSVADGMLLLGVRDDSGEVWRTPMDGGKEKAIERMGKHQQQQQKTELRQFYYTDAPTGSQCNRQQDVGVGRGHGPLNSANSNLPRAHAAHLQPLPPIKSSVQKSPIGAGPCQGTKSGQFGERRKNAPAHFWPVGLRSSNRVHNAVQCAERQSAEFGDGRNGFAGEERDEGMGAGEESGRHQKRLAPCQICEVSLMREQNGLNRVSKWAARCGGSGEIKPFDWHHRNCVYSRKEERAVTDFLLLELSFGEERPRRWRGLAQ